MIRKFTDWVWCKYWSLYLLSHIGSDNLFPNSTYIFINKKTGKTSAVHIDKNGKVTRSHD